MTGKIKLPHQTSGSMSIAAPATQPSGDLELKLPATIGSANQLLKNSGTAGTLEFASNITVDSNGRLLLGTTDPGEGNGDEATFYNNGNAGITIRSAADADCRIYFSEGTSGGSQYRGAIHYDHDTHYMAFSTNENERLRIDSSGRLRVGNTTASADSAFDDLIVGNHSGNVGISVLGENGQQSAIGFAKSGALSDGYVAYNHNSTATSSSMYIKSSGKIQLDTAGSVRLQIHSDGNITKPTSSKFAAKLVYQNAYLSSGTILQFDSTTNEGSDYSNSTERYTAPVDGFYAFWFHTNVHKTGGEGAFYTDWYKNGSNIVNSYGGRIYGNWDGAWENHSGCIGLHLDAGDYVSIHAGDSNAKYDGGAYGQFMGWLVG